MWRLPILARHWRYVGPRWCLGGGGGGRPQPERASSADAVAGAACRQLDVTYAVRAALRAGLNATTVLLLGTERDGRVPAPEEGPGAALLASRHHEALEHRPSLRVYFEHWHVHLHPYRHDFRSSERVELPPQPDLHREASGQPRLHVPADAGFSGQVVPQPHAVAASVKREMEREQAAHAEAARKGRGKHGRRFAGGRRLLLMVGTAVFVMLVGFVLLRVAVARMPGLRRRLGLDAGLKDD